MNVTTEDILSYIRNVGTEIKSRTPRIEAIEADNQSAEQFQMNAVAARASVCSPKLAEALEGNVDMTKLKSEMGDQFLNYDFMRAVGCSVYSTFHGISEATDNIARLTALKNDVRNLHQFGGKSAYGYALTGELSGAKDFFVVKTARGKEAEEDLLHELFVAIVALNELREVMAHFAMVFGGFKCPKAVIDEATGTVASYCGTIVGQVPYIIYEKIAPSESLEAAIPKCTVQQFFSLLFQHLFATHIAAELVGYTHYDCHLQNCLVREVSVDGIEGKFCIPYVDPRTKQEWFVEADRVITFIDYGMASVNYQGRAVGSGNIKLERYGVHSGAWPLHDAYKTICSMIYILSNGQGKTNAPVLNELVKIFKFFNKTEDPISAVKRQAELRTFFSLPKMAKTEKYGMLDLISHILTVCDVGGVVTDEPAHPILECTSCHSFAAVVEGAYIKDPQPKNVFDFYNVATHYGRTSKISYDRLVNNFKATYPSAIAEFKKQVLESVKELRVELEHKFAPKLPGTITARTLADKKLYADIQEAYYHIVAAIAHYEDVRTWLSVGNAVAIIYSDRDAIAFINKQRNAISDPRDEIVAKIDTMKNLYYTFLPILSSPEWDRHAAARPWYRVNSGEIVHLRDRFNQIDKKNLFVEQRLPSTIVEGDVQLNKKTATRPPLRQRVAPTGVTVLPPNRRVTLRRDNQGAPTKIEVGGRR